MPNTPEQQRQRATVTGTWAGERRATAQLCHNLRNSIYAAMYDAERFGWPYEPPICDEWLEPSRDGLRRMVEDVINAVGLRPSNRHRLAPDPIGRMHRYNVRYVVPLTRAAPPACECDWSRRDACARSARPCSWAAEQHVLDLFEVEGDWFSRGPFGVHGD